MEIGHFFDLIVQLANGIDDLLWQPFAFVVLVGAVELIRYIFFGRCE